MNSKDGIKRNVKTCTYKTYMDEYYVSVKYVTYLFFYKTFAFATVVHSCYC